MTAVYVIMIIAASLALIGLIPVNVIADIAYKSDNRAYAKILCFKFTLYPSEEVKKAADTAESDYETEEKDRGTLDTFKLVKRCYGAAKENIKELINYIFAEAIVIRELNISGIIGTGNPMYTGMVYGAVSAAVYGFIGAADAKKRIKRYNIDIKADFDNTKLAAGVYAEIYMRIYHIISAAVKAMIIYIKIKHSFKEVTIDE